MLRTTTIASFLFTIAVVFPTASFAANPTSVISPSQNIQDPGASSTPWGGCGPTDSNCYVDLTTGSFTNVTVTGSSTLTGTTNINTVGTATTTIGSAGTTTTIAGAANLTGAVTFTALPSFPLSANSLLIGSLGNIASALPAGSNGQILQIVAGAPTYAMLDLQTSVTGLLPVVNGGTGASTAAAARTNLGAAKSGSNADITDLTGLSTITVGTQVTTPSLTIGSLTGPVRADAGILSSSLIDLSIDVANALPVANGGTGSATMTGLVKGNGTSAYTAAVAGTDYQVPLIAGNGLSLSGDVLDSTWTTSTITPTDVYANNSGNVGIGMTVPTSKLHVGGTAMASNFAATATGTPSTFAGDVTLSRALNLPSSTSTAGIITQGPNRLLHTYAASGTSGSNMFLGNLAGNTALTGAATGVEGSYNVVSGPAAPR